MPEPIITEDGATVHKGDRVYNYYDMEPCTIVSEPDHADWFWVKSERGETILNGARICTIAFAQRRGFRNA
jgi:hypothetical protein